MDQEFRECHGEYCECCEKEFTLERSFCKPLVDSANTIIGISSRSTFRGIPFGIPQYYVASTTRRSFKVDS